jgi:hypothetical protein
MTLTEARNVACNPIDVPRADLALALDVLRRELDRAEAHSAEQERLRTLGGVPPAVDYEWANERRVPPPATASDPSAPPLVRA